MYITDLRDEDIELSVKVVIVGNGAVGKSSMIQVSLIDSFKISWMGRRGPPV